MTIVSGTPRWAVVAAWAVPACVLPSAVYRVGLMPTGSASLDWYLGGLSAGSMILGLLTLGLVQPWGERLPGWIPSLGGRPIPRAAAAGSATTGGVIVLLVCLYVVLNSTFDFVERGPVLIGADQPPMPPPSAGVIWCYVPLLAWAPLLLTAAYRTRRSAAA